MRKEELEEKRDVVLEAIALRKQANELIDRASELMSEAGITLCNPSVRGRQQGGPTEIHVYQGIEKLEELFGTEAQVGIRGDEDPHFKHVVIEDAVLFQIVQSDSVRAQIVQLAKEVAESNE